MAKPPAPDARNTAEERFAQARVTDETAASIIQAERLAREKKTALLRELRLAKEAAAGVSILDKKKPPKKTSRRVR
jgi:hypothetical protein